MNAGLVRVTAAMNGAQDATDTGTGTCARPRRRSACFERAAPARQGNQIAAAINGHQPGSLGNTAPDKDLQEWPGWATL
jgi:hypothetical protein